MLALCLGEAASAAEPLSEQEGAYVGLVVGSMLVSTKCSGVVLVPEGIQRLADQVGIDREKIGAAIVNALLVNANREYDSTALIPAVTRKVVEAANAISADLEAHKKTGCKANTEPLIKLGVLKAQ